MAPYRRTQAAPRQPNAEDFSSDLQDVGQMTLAESTFDDEDYDPLQPARRNVSNTRSSAPVNLDTVAGTYSDHPPPVILNDANEGLGSQKVKATDDIAWFFETEPADGTRTCRVCR